MTTRLKANLHFIPVLPLMSMILTLTQTFHKSILYSLFKPIFQYSWHGLPLKNEISAMVSKIIPGLYKVCYVRDINVQEQHFQTSVLTKNRSKVIKYFMDYA